MLPTTNKFVIALSLGVTLLGLIASLVTIYLFFGSEFGIVDLGGSEGIAAAQVWVAALVGRWSVGPLVSALLVYLIVAVIVFVADTHDDERDYCLTLQFSCPLPGWWALLFWNVVDTVPLILFGLGYAIGPWLIVTVPGFLYDVISERVSPPESLRGKITRVERRVKALVGMQMTTYVLVVEREGDVPAKAEYTPWMGQKERLPTVGSDVRLEGSWGRSGVFRVSRVESI